MLKLLYQIVDQFFTLQSSHFTFKESEFDLFKQDHSQRLLDNFFDMALGGITVAFVFRILILRSSNAILDLILPFIIMMFITLLYYINKNTSQMKHYFHNICIPLIGLLTARKTISQDKTHFFLNESFASWLIMMIFGSFSSPKQWYQVVGINFFSFFTYILIVFKQYGLVGIGNDFYVHITTTIIFSACLIRMNELNLRNSFNLLSLSKIQERKWQRVLALLTDGVLIMQHTDNEKGVLLINQSLQKIFGKQQEQKKEQDCEGNQGVHTCAIKDKQIDQKQQSQDENDKKNIGTSINPGFCVECQSEKRQIEDKQKKIEQEQQKKSKAKQAEEQLQNKLRFNEKRVGPVFDELFRNIKFKIVLSEKNLKGIASNKQDRHTKEVQFMNDFICKQMEYFQKDLPQGYSEHLFLKVLDPNRIIELNIVKLDDECQVLFLFKEVSVYNRLQKARTTEKFSNVLINSIAHNLFTPLNALIQLTKSMSDLIVGVNAVAEKNVQMIGICLQQLVFTTHNILEMSKIRQGRFKPTTKAIEVPEKLDCIFDFFKDDMKFREIDYEIKCEEQIKNFMIILDDARFSIVLYNLISNSVKHTNGGHIKVSVKILTQKQLELKMEKISKMKQKQDEQEKLEQLMNIQKQEDQGEEENSLSSANSMMKSTPQKAQEGTEDEQTDNDLKDKKGNKIQELNEKIYLSVSVGDSGVGMDADMRKKCFTLFGNLKIKKDVNQGGMGLGLASANLICKALKGELNLVRSETNDGSKFNFYMPVEQGKLILGKQKKNKGDDSSSEESDENSSHDDDSDNTKSKHNSSFENKKAQIINNIRIQQEKEKNKQKEA